MAVTDEKGEISWILEDDECGQFAVVEEDEVPRAVAVHFFFIHHRTGGDLIEGRDWRRLDPAPHCDLCGTIAELPWWEHIATPPLVEVDDRDGRWLVCDPCHELVVHKDAEQLFHRAWTQSTQVSPWVTTGDLTTLLQQRLRRMMTLAIESFDAGRRETL